MWISSGGSRLTVSSEDDLVLLIQIVSDAPDLIQANHTSAVGQSESVNFTITPTSLALGCHIEVSQILGLHLS